MKDFFLTIIGLLNGVGRSRWVDKDTGQLENYDTKPSVPFPCYLVKYSLKNCVNIGGQVQTGDVTLEVRVADDLSVMETSSKANSAALQRSLAYEDDVQEAYLKLQGYCGNGIDNLNRISAEQEKRTDGLTVVKLIFASKYIDQSAGV
jgi:hypothetical protein